MRQLTNQERELTIKGIDKIDLELKNLDELLDMANSQRNFNLTRRDFEDKIRPFNRKREDEEFEAMIKNLQSDIKSKEFSKNQMTKQIENGVEEKTADKMPGID
jgi:hypothetical protein